MEERRDEYLILYKETVIARFYSLGDAIIFLEACDFKYYDEPAWEYTIRRVDNRVMQAG